MMIVDIKLKELKSPDVIMVVGDDDPIRICTNTMDITDDEAEFISRKLLEFPEVEVKLEMNISMRTRVSLRRLLENHKIPYDSYYTTLKNGERIVDHH